MNRIRYEVRLLYDDESCPHGIKREALYATFLDRDAAVTFAQGKNRSSRGNGYVVIRVLEDPVLYNGRLFDEHGDG